MGKFIELTKTELHRDDHKVVVNCDQITYIEPNGDGSFVRFGHGHFIAVCESFAEVSELIELATSDTIKR